jgi:hypothetical protein
MDYIAVGEYMSRPSRTKVGSYNVGESALSPADLPQIAMTTPVMRERPIRDQAVLITGGMPAHRAMCGFFYQASELGQHTAWATVPVPRRCRRCIAAIGRLRA